MGKRKNSGAEKKYIYILIGMWLIQLYAFVKTYPNVNLGSMGFPVFQLCLNKRNSLINMKIPFIVATENLKNLGV